MSKIKQLQEIIDLSENIVFFGGAGVSTESGIPDFRSEKGIFNSLEKYGETPETNNPISNLMDEINGNKYIHIFMSPQKTLEYDLFMLNPKTITEALIDLWKNDTGKVYQALDSIVIKCDDNTYPNGSEEFANFGKYVLEHIEDSTIGKGFFAQELSKKIDSSFVVPEYIKNAVLWVCKNG